MDLSLIGPAVDGTDDTEEELVAVWVAAGRFVATRPVLARALGRWGHLVLPVVLIGLELSILSELR